MTVTDYHPTDTDMHYATGWKNVIEWICRGSLLLIRQKQPVYHHATSGGTLEWCQSGAEFKSAKHNLLLSTLILNGTNRLPKIPSNLKRGGWFKALTSTSSVNRLAYWMPYDRFTSPQWWAWRSGREDRIRNWLTKSSGESVDCNWLKE